MSDRAEESRVELPFKTPEELENYLPYLAARLSRRWETDQNLALAELDVQGARMRVLSCLSAFDELTISELSVLSVTEQSTTSRTVEQLVETGFVERSISENDQRVRTVALTGKGERKVDALAPSINVLYRSLVEDIDEAELKTCIRVLQQILKKIKKNQI